MGVSYVVEQLGGLALKLLHASGVVIGDMRMYNQSFMYALLLGTKAM